MKTPAEIRDYAQARANATGRPYLVSNMGHVWLDCASNRQLAQDCEGIRERVYPNYTPQ